MVGTVTLTRLLVAIANLDHKAAMAFSTRHRRWRRPDWRDATSSSSPSVSPRFTKATLPCTVPGSVTTLRWHKT